jgi:hypothetical protein
MLFSRQMSPDVKEILRKTNLMGEIGCRLGFITGGGWCGHV